MNPPAIKRPQRRTLLSVVLPLVAALVFTGCAPRAGGDAASSGGSLFINLPSIIVEYDESGEASLLNMPVSELGELLGSDLSSLSFEAETVSAMVNNGIQHIQIDNQPGGIRFYQNSKPLPSLVWDDDARAGLGNVLEMVAEDAGPIAPLLPLLPDIGLGLTLKMPSSGQEISTDITNDTLLDVAKAEGILSQVRSTPVNPMTIVYSEDGSLVTGNVPFVLFAVPWAQMQMPPDTIASIMDMGIETASITILSNGLAIKVNGEEIPFINWNDQQEFNNFLSLLPVMLGPDSGIEPMLGLMPMLLSLANGISIDISFPTAG
ncbi:MAG: hypothetical protein AAF702_05680 [Chloroflexota bacterium]